MGRKSKQPGGHHPLTHHERTKKFRSSQYGTTTARLSTDSQGGFGDCALSLTAAQDPVASPSGTTYSREAIVEYLLQKSTQVKKARANYEAYLIERQLKHEEEAAQEKQRQVEAFEDSQKVTATRKRPRGSGADKPANALAVSYWLAEFQPEHDGAVPDPPPERPPSPHSGQPLRLKDLQPLIIKRAIDGKPLCALSEKTITTQPVVAVKKHVVLEAVYEDVVKPSMLHPFTGEKLKSKHILKLKKGKSGFASSGPVEAKAYRPTIT